MARIVPCSSPCTGPCIVHYIRPRIDPRIVPRIYVSYYRASNILIEYPQQAHAAAQAYQLRIHE